MRLFLLLYIIAFSSSARLGSPIIIDYEALFNSSINVSTVAVVSVSSTDGEHYFLDLISPDVQHEVVEVMSGCFGDIVTVNVKVSLLKVLKGKPKPTYLLSYYSCTANVGLSIFSRLIVYEGVNGKLRWQYAQ